MAATTAAETREEGPVLSVVSKRLRGLKKKLNRISQMEEAIAQGKPINKEQEEVLKSKPFLLVSIDELEKLRAPLASALAEEPSLSAPAPPRNDDDGGEGGGSFSVSAALEDLLTVIYFGSLFDVKPQGEFTATMLTRTHERGCCLTYDVVTDDADDMLGERDLDLISGLSGLLVSRPADSGLSHKDALRRCLDHAKLWLSNSNQPLDPDSNVSYSGLREKLNKIMNSDYFTTTPEMKGPVEIAGNYVPFQVPEQGVPMSVPVQMEGSATAEHYHQEEEDATEDFQGHEVTDNQSIPAEELQKGEAEIENHVEVVSGDLESAQQPAELDQYQREVDSDEQNNNNNSRRNYQNNRGGRVGGRGGGRGYPNGRGGRLGGRGGGGGGYQNGRGQYYDQPGNYYPRNYYNSRGRGGGRGGGHPYNNRGPVQGDVGVAS